MADESYDPRYLEGICCFNARAFFEAHEVWEDLWHATDGPARRFYQGLIQVAVCLHHFGRGNTIGAKKLYTSSRGYLESYRPRYQGLDLDRLFGTLEQCCAGLFGDEASAARATLPRELIPVLQLDPPSGEAL